MARIPKDVIESLTLPLEAESAEVGKPMYKNAEKWEVTCPASLIPAVKALRSGFEEAHRSFSNVTEELTNALIHVDGLARIPKKVPGMVELKRFAGPTATDRFNETLMIGTPPAIFRAFLTFYQDALTVKILEIFRHLLQIGSANRDDLKGNYWDWAKQQSVHLIRSEAYRIRLWVWGCCDTAKDPLEINAAKWRNWQAPKLLTMTPAHTSPHIPEEEWERLDAKNSEHLLNYFEEFYVLHLELFLNRAWEKITIERAKQPRATLNARIAGLKPSGEVSGRPLVHQRGGTLRHLETQKRHEAWKQEYRKLITQRPGMSDVWYSQRIAALPIGRKASPETIRKNMK